MGNSVIFWDSKGNPLLAVLAFGDITSEVLDKDLTDYLIKFLKDYNIEADNSSEESAELVILD